MTVSVRVKDKVFEITISGNNEASITCLRKEEGQCTRESGDSNRLVVGNSDNGGAANVNWDQPGDTNDNIGFRAAVVLSSKRIRPALCGVGLIFRWMRI